MKVEIILSSETSVYIQSTQCYIPEDGNMHLRSSSYVTEHGLWDLCLVIRSVLG
jgi:hypothetical protein